MLKNFLYRRGDLFLFYDNETAHKFILSRPEHRRAVFVANNTVPPALYSNIAPSTFEIINVGTINKRKENKALLAAVARLVKAGHRVEVTFVGEGAEESELRLIAEKDGIERLVNFVGHVEDPALLAQYYSRAAVSVSFGQCGLALLQSFAHRRAFITKESCVTGGESANLISGYNGYFVRDEDDLYEKLRYLIQRRDVLDMLNENSLNFYKQRANFGQFVRAFLGAFSQKLDPGEGLAN